jgi:GAF domain-containing protein/HAMP domain-containing protein
VAYAPGDLFLHGVTLYNAVSGGLLILLCGVIIRPRNRTYWILTATLYLITVFSFSQIDNLERFDISLSPSWQISLPIFTLVISLALIWQLTQVLQYSPIRVRRFVILLSLGLIPTIIAMTISSTMVYQHNQQEEIEHLETIAAFIEIQIGNLEETFKGQSYYENVQAIMAGNNPQLTDTLAVPTDIGETGEIYIVGQDHQFLLGIKNSGLFIPEEPYIFSPGVTRTIESKGKTSALHMNYLGEQVVGIYRWLPGLSAVLVVEKNQTEAFKEFRAIIFTNLVIVTVVLALAIVMSFRITKNILDPINTITEKAKQFTAGEIVLIDAIPRKDEIGELSQAMNQMTVHLSQSMNEMEQIVSERTEALERRAVYLEAAAEIGRAATDIHELEKLLTTVTHLISEKFGFYHVGVFLLDDRGEFAELKAANSEGGWRMLSRGHKLRVGEQGIVGYVSGTKKPRIQQQVSGDDSLYYSNPDLPRTQSEMALPLIIGGELIGVLDVQSTYEEAFDEEDISVLQVLADEVAIAINNTRLFEQLQENLEIERRLYGELTQEAWTSIQEQSKHKLNVKSDKTGVHLISGEFLPESKQAIRIKSTVQPGLDEDEQKYPLSIPVKVRGDIVIAVLETYKPVDAGPWLPQEIEVLEAIGEQLGIALENARLYEETQRLAQRERISADVATKIWSSTNIDTILQTAVQELGRTLKVSQGAIRLNIQEGNDSDARLSVNLGDSES